MIYPQGKIIHQNLAAEFTDVQQLLNILRAKGFSGVIEVEAEGRTGAFFIISGRIVTAAIGLESNPPAMVGDAAVNELYILARRPRGLLHVSELSAAQIEILTGPFVSEPVFKGLSTDFILVDQFVAKLKSQGHTGYVDIFSKTGDKIGTLLFKDGEATSFQMVSGSGNVNFYEGESVPSALDYAVRNGALFDVYRSAGTADSASSFPAGDRTEGLSPEEPLAEAEPEVPGGDFEGPAPEATTEQVEGSGAEPPAEKQKLSFTERLAEQLAQMPEPVEVEGEPASDTADTDRGTGFDAIDTDSKTAGPSPQEDEASIKDRMDLISDLERVLSKLESFTDHIGSKGDFQRLFRHNCVEESEEYHFLDPFEGQFEYDSGKIALSGDVGSGDFAIATANCLNIVLANLNKDYLKGAALPPGLKGEIETTFRNYKEIIKNAGLPSIVPANMR